MRWTMAAACASAIATAACGGSPAAPTAPPIPPSIRLPAEMRLTASAEGRADAQTITCRLDFVAILREADDGMHGAMGGEALRARVGPDGSGEAFSADAHYPEIRIDVDAAGGARLRAFHDGAPRAGTGESRFWDALVAFEGAYDRAANTIAGAWTCRPLDVRSDVSGDVTGTWALRPRR